MSAAMSLGLVGTMEDTPELSRCLHHADYFVVTRAEQALWSIWFRASTSECCAWLQESVTAMQAGQFAEAERLLDKILIADPTFAEACNQRAILHYLTDRFPSSVMACMRTLALNPKHFGAAAGLGHNRFQLGQYDDAEIAYRRALHLHPRMEGVRQQLRRVREARAALPTSITSGCAVDVTLPFPPPQCPSRPR